MTERVPVRIQLWIDGTRLDIRGWLDEFSSTLDTPEISKNWTTRFSGRHDYKVLAHDDGRDAPWKFERGKPKR